MTSPDDDLAALKRAWSRATPRPDPGRRAADLAAAREAFDRRVRLGGRLAVPPGLAGRLKDWAGRLGLGGLAAAATAVVAGVFVLLPAGQQVWERPKVAPAEDAAPARVPESAEADPAAGAVRQRTADGTPEAADGMAERAALPPEPAGGDAPEAGALRQSGDAPEAEDGMAERAALSPEPAGGDVPDADALRQSGDAPEAEDGIAERTALAPEATTLAAPAVPDAWAVVRQALEAGVLPPPEAVRVAEMVAAVPSASARPLPVAAPGGPVATALSVVAAPWNPAGLLVRLDLGPAPEPFGVGIGWVGAEARALGDAASALGDAPVTLVYAVTPGSDAATLSLTVGGGEAVVRPLMPTGPPDAAAAVAGFGLLLGGADLGGWSYGDAAALAEAQGSDLARSLDAVALMRRAEALAD